jgi:chromosome segregation ATPase
MPLKLTNEYYDLIDGATRSPDIEVAVKALTACRSHIAACHVELRELRAQQKNHERQLTERDTVIKELRSKVESLDEQIDKEHGWVD